MADDKCWVNGRCVTCKARRTPQGHDPCIANLPGVSFACCGHGVEAGYIKFEDGRCLRFVPTEVTLDLASVKTNEPNPVAIFQLGSSRVFDFEKKKVRLHRYDQPVSDRLPKKAK